MFFFGLFSTLQIDDENLLNALNARILMELFKENLIQYLCCVALCILSTTCNSIQKHILSFYTYKLPYPIVLSLQHIEHHGSFRCFVREF